MKIKLLSKLLIIGGFLFSVSAAAQTLTHSYTFEDGTWSGTTVNDQVGSVNGTINGTDWEIKNGYFQNRNSTQGATNMGGYISFSGSDLALNTYSAITLETYMTLTNDLKNPNKWSESLYFGGATGATSLMLQLDCAGTTSRTGVNNSVFAGYTTLTANTTHHFVVVLVPSTASTAGYIAFYDNGSLVQSSPLTANTYNTAVSAIATTNAFLGKGGWANPLSNFKFHEFNIYNGEMTAETVATRYAAMNSKLNTLTVSAGTLVPAFSADVLNYGVVLLAGTTSFTVDATPSSSNFSSVSGTGTVDVSGANYGTVTLKALSTGTPYILNWRKSVTTPVLTHSYTFSDGTARDIVGADNGTLNGGAITGGIYTSTVAANYGSGNSQYISLPATSIAINNYPAVSFEIVGKTSNSSAGCWTYFGNQTKGGQSGSATGTSQDYIFLHTNNANNNYPIVTSCNTNYNPWQGNSYSTGIITNDNKVHHIVGIMNMDSIIIYQDGVYKGSSVLNNNNRLFNISNAVAYIGRGGYTGDNNLTGSIGEFNIWKGRLAPSAIADRYSAYMQDARLSGITLSSGSISFDPAVTSYNVSVSSATTSVTVGATSSKDFVLISGIGETALTAGTGTATITVTAADGTTTKTYSLNFSPTTKLISNNISALNAYSKSGKLVVYSENNFSIYNALGKKLAQRSGSHITQQIDLTNGVYFVKSNGETIKVIVQ